MGNVTKTMAEAGVVFYSKIATISCEPQETVAVFASVLFVALQYDLSLVYVIAFLEQALPHSDEALWDSDEALWDSERCVSYYQMTEKRTGEFAPDTIICICGTGEIPQGRGGTRRKA